MGFRFQFCFQILTLEIEQNSFKQKGKIDFFFEKMPNQLAKFLIN